MIIFYEYFRHIANCLINKWLSELEIKVVIMVGGSGVGLWPLSRAGPELHTPSNSWLYMVTTP